MPIWFEMIVLMLVSYGAGALLGWMIWNGAADPDADADMIEGDDL
ncbi:hypothetical protein [Erythrobacter sp. QSSC1-22B]|nr:hypothetical protein [Erythrobacter sp. QSSC1-22B]